MTTEHPTPVQERLDKAGVKDVKFLFGPETNGALASSVLSDVEDVLTKYLNGDYRVVADFSQEELPAAR